MVGALRRKVRGAFVDVFGPGVVREINRAFMAGEYGEVSMGWWKRLVAFMNGKKRYTGLALMALPKVVALVAGAMAAAGFDPMEIAKWTAWGSGGLLFAIGIVHRIAKWLDDLTPDGPSGSGVAGAVLLLGVLSRSIATVLVVVGLGMLPGCAHILPRVHAEIEIGGKPGPVVDQRTVESKVCRGNVTGAWIYLVEEKGVSRDIADERIERAIQAAFKRKDCCLANECAAAAQGAGVPMPAGGVQ